MAEHKYNMNFSPLCTFIDLAVILFYLGVLIVSSKDKSSTVLTIAGSYFGDTDHYANYYVDHPNYYFNLLELHSFRHLSLALTISVGPTSDALTIYLSHPTFGSCKADYANHTDSSSGTGKVLNGC